MLHAGSAPWWTLVLGALVLLFSQWEPPAPQQDGTNLLRGTWERVYSEKGTQVRRTLTLAERGAFREHVRVVEADGRVTEFSHEGTWLYDGTNLKRRYTLVNGEPPSRLRPPFATFEISFESGNAFTGVDHVHGHTVRYRRVGYDG